jgi:hypothetical protein
MATHGGPNIVEDGLIFYIDSANTDSWNGPDSSLVNGLKGNNTGSIFNDTSGSYGNNDSFNFDGVDSYVQTDFSGLNYLSAMTLSIWAKTPDTSRYQFLFANNSTGSDGVWLNQYSSLSGVNDVTIFYLEGGYVYFSNPNNNILDNTWFNFTAVFDASGSSNTDKVKIYVNGSQVTYIDGGIAFPSFRIPASPNTLKIGDGTRFASDPAWEGNIGPAKIYNLALSAQEVKQNFNALNRFGI